jgi:hypothetical protein
MDAKETALESSAIGVPAESSAFQEKRKLSLLFSISTSAEPSGSYRSPETRNTALALIAASFPVRPGRRYWERRSLALMNSWGRTRFSFVLALVGAQAMVSSRSRR